MRVDADRAMNGIEGETIGILYMGFGARAGVAIRRSIASLARIHLEIPVAVVGDVDVPGTQCIPWTGESPFDLTQRPHFQFRAGRVKPCLYSLSPFDRTLYVDAETTFVGDIRPGFELLSQVEMAVTTETKSLRQLTNRPHGLWEYNLAERDATVEEIGGDGEHKLFNSGVIFFRKGPRVEALFQEWARQWQRWQEWDEQLALIRALHRSDVSYQVLGVEWNQPRRAGPKIIFHPCATGAARTYLRPARERRPG